MAYLVHFEFPSPGPFGEEAGSAYAELAADIAAEEGLVWKVWTEDAAACVAGGVYLFVDRAAADRYVARHTDRLAGFGIGDVTARGFEVNEPLSLTTHANLRRA